MRPRGTDWPTSRMIGIAGEHYVASKLAMAGVLPIVLAAGHPGTDIIAEAGGRSVTLQVKTRGSTNPHAYDLKGDELVSDFLVLVRLTLWRRRGRRANAGPDSYGELKDDDPQTPRACVLPRNIAEDAWKLGGHADSRRPSLRLAPIRHLMEGREESWDVVARALEVEPTRTAAARP